MSDYIPNNYTLPDTQIGNDNASQRSSKSGCVLLTLPGCIAAGCALVVAVCCALPLATGLGLGGLAAWIYNTGVTRSGEEVLRYEPSEQKGIRIDDPNVNITMTPGIENELRFTYELTAYGYSKGNAQDNLDSMQVIAKRQPNGLVDIVVDTSQVTVSIYDANLTITAPAEMDLVQINGGEMTLEDISGEFDLNSNDDIMLQNVEGLFDVSTTSFGEISFRGELRSGQQHRFETHSGDITLDLVGERSLRWDVLAESTISDLTCPNAPRDNRCSGSVGDADTQLRVTTNSGDVTLRLP